LKHDSRHDSKYNSKYNLRDNSKYDLIRGTTGSQLGQYYDVRKR